MQIQVLSQVCNCYLPCKCSIICTLFTTEAVEHGALTFNKQSMRVLADDYILPVEPVVDYVTRFSGITAEDLNPLTSRHSVLSQRSAYLKLRYFIDRKCIFVGHGLQKDFETANIFIPPQQVRVPLMKTETNLACYPNRHCR